MSIDLSLAASIRLEALRDAARICEKGKAKVKDTVPDLASSGFLLGVTWVEDRLNLMIAAAEAVWREELNDCGGRTED